VIDPAGRHFVGVEEERCDRKPGSVGARALLTSSGGRIHAGHVPDREAPAAEDASPYVGPPHLEELHTRPIHHEKVAIAVSATLVALLTLDGPHQGHGDRVNVAVGPEVVLGRGEGAQRC
jgi:hypothetical protein